MKVVREWLRCAALCCVVLGGVGFAERPRTTVVQDVVYKADGKPATGVLVIAWPAFVTADGAAVAAGSKTVTLGADGSFRLELAPNAGGTPAGSYYTVTLKLDSGAPSREVWVVPSSSPATLARVRATEVPATMAAQAVTADWIDANTVNLAGEQTVTGAKTFSVSPIVPTPTSDGGAANKAYVDQNSVAGPNVAKVNVQNTWTQPQSWFNTVSGPFASGRRFDHYKNGGFSTSQFQGGLNANLYSLIGKTTQESLTASLYGNTVGQRYVNHSVGYGFAPGDVVGGFYELYGPAGVRDPGDEGVEGPVVMATETVCVYRGTVSGTPGMGTQSVTVVPATNFVAGECPNGTQSQGEGRWLLNTSRNVTEITATAVTDNVQQLNSTYGFFSTITVPSVAVSMGAGTLSSAVTVNAGATVPGTQTVGYAMSIGALAPGLACVGDESSIAGGSGGQGNWEAINITGVAGGSLTAAFVRAHPAGAAIFQGGPCGQFVEVEADTLAAGTIADYGESTVTSNYPVRYPWPVLGALDATHLIVWTARGAGGGFASTFANSTQKKVRLFYGAEAYSVVDGSGALSNTLTLAPNNIAWGSGDAVEQSHYPAQKTTGARFMDSSWSHHGFGSYGLIVSRSGAVENNDDVALLKNNNSYANYKGGGGAWTLPIAMIETQGPANYLMKPNLGYGPLPGGYFAVPCPYAGCSDTTEQKLFTALGAWSVANGDYTAYSLSGNEWRTYVNSTKRLAVNGTGITVNGTITAGSGANQITTAAGLLDATKLTGAVPAASLPAMSGRMTWQMGTSSTTNGTAGATLYFGMVGGTQGTATNVIAWVAPKACTLTFVNCGIYVAGAKDTGSGTFTCKVSDLTSGTLFNDSAVMFTAASTSSQGTATTSDAVAAGDRLVVRIDEPATFGATPTTMNFAFSGLCE